MYIVVVGAGSIGSRFIEIATAARHNLVVIEKDTERAKTLAAEYDVTVISGDATNKGTLREIGVDKVDALVVTTNDDSENLMVSSIAKGLGILNVYSIVNDPDKIELFEAQEVHIISDPSDIVAHRLYNDVCHPHLEGYTALYEGSAAFRITIDEDSELIDKSPSECIDTKVIPQRSVVVAIQRGKERWIPSEKDLNIQVGDIITIFTLNGKTLKKE